jgi:hypothetical protein
MGHIAGLDSMDRENAPGIAEKKLWSSSSKPVTEWAIVARQTTLNHIHFQMFCLWDSEMTMRIDCRKRGQEMLFPTEKVNLITLPAALKQNVHFLNSYIQNPKAVLKCSEHCQVDSYISWTFLHVCPSVSVFVS